MYMPKVVKQFFILAGIIMSIFFYAKVQIARQDIMILQTMLQCQASEPRLESQDCVKVAMTTALPFSKVAVK